MGKAATQKTESDPTCLGRLAPNSADVQHCLATLWGRDVLQCPVLGGIAAQTKSGRAITMPNISYLRAPDVVCANMDGEPVIMSLEHNVYFGISGIGSFVWDQLEQAQTLDALVTQTCSRYDVDEQTCRHDLEKLLRDMQANGLVRTV
jgi:hypothetical protein